jgi:TolB-like protein/DNA-binding winged helix-turn-helix (wHTH) protein
MVHVFESFELDAGTFELRRDGVCVAVEPQVLSLLFLLADNAHRLVTRDEIIDTVWNGRIVSESALSSRIKSARQSIGDDGLSQRLIRTIHGKGFRFVGLDTVLRVTITVPGDAPIQVMTPLKKSQRGRPSIAVLPFTIRSPTDGGALMAMALPHDLITGLSRLHWLFVIARGSSFRFDAPNTDVRTVGKRLGARYCLTGTVGHGSGGISIVVELTDTQDRGVIWGESYDTPAERVHEIRASIIASVVAALEIQIPAHEAQAARLKSPEQIDAWAYYHLGLQQVFRFNRLDNEQAIVFFEQATTVEPGFARAVGGLSFAYFQNAFLGYGRDIKVDALKARRYAEQAMSIDALDPFSNFNMGRAHWLTGDVETSLGWLDRAINLNPNYAQGIYARAWSQMVLCRGVGAQQDADAAMLLSPIDPLYYAMVATRALSHLVQGEEHQAAIWADRAARSPGAHHLIGVIAVACHELDGSPDTAQAWADRVRRTSPAVSQAAFFRSFPFEGGIMKQRLASALAARGI